MKYRVIEYFKDLQDNGYEYTAGATYPRSGLDVSEERIAELSGSDNLRGIPLIEATEEKPKKSRKK